ncbi:MAG: arsenate reductase ArsC [Rhodobacteraceae bacterium]|nr:arsenate reductase ArsC [Paracoccaceae bacterium]
MIRILTVCPGNDAGSILLESILRTHGRGRLEVCSAGTAPQGVLHGGVAALLAELGHDAAPLHPKPLPLPDEGAGFDLVIALMPGLSDVLPHDLGPVAEWALPDPLHEAALGPRALADGLRTACMTLHARASALLALPLEDMDRDVLRARAERIGHLF